MDILESLARNEEAIAEPYGIYAGEFPQYKEFWLDLIKEENEHAGWIRQLVSNTEGDDAGINEGRFNEAALQTYHKYLEGEVDRAKRQTISLKDALTAALYVEKSLIESRVFDIFPCYSEELKKVLMGLKRATEQHLGRVQRAWTAIK